MKFRSRVYNRPDLVPIAKAIEYARKRPYYAVLDYCGSSEIAGRLVRDITPDVFFSEDIRMTPTGNGKERVKLRNFSLGEAGSHWVVVAFNLVYRPLID